MHVGRSRERSVVVNLISSSDHGEAVWVFDSAMLANDSKRLLSRESTLVCRTTVSPRQCLTNNIIGPPDHRQSGRTVKRVKLYSDVLVVSLPTRLCLPFSVTAV